MDKRITVAGCPVNIHSRSADESFRIEITPLTDCDETISTQIYDRAKSWSGQLRGQNDNVSLRCYRDGRLTILEDVRSPLAASDMDNLAQYLQSTPATAAAGAGAGGGDNGELVGST